MLYPLGYFCFLKRELMKLLLVMPLFLMISCDSFACNPVGPSNTSGLPWSPFIGIHASGEAHEAYQKSIPILRDRGNMVGARVELVPADGLNNQTIKMIGSLGIELVALINNAYVFDPNVEARIDEIYAAYPEVRYFQVGNEVTNFTSMSIVQYMVALRRVYDHTQRNYSDRNVTLITQSTFGSGRKGGLELEEMVGLGLREMSNQKLIVGINVYTQEAILEYSRAIREHLSGYRIWVMETGNCISSLSQVEFVRSFYPQIGVQFGGPLRAERIYWYVMWEGDANEKCSLISNVLSPPVTFSPLFQELAGVAE